MFVTNGTSQLEPTAAVRINANTDGYIAMLCKLYSGNLNTVSVEKTEKRWSKSL